MDDNLSEDNIGDELVPILASKWVALPIVEDYIFTARRFIHEHNLFSSAALHLASAVLQGCKGILVDDYYFKRLD